MKLVSLLSLLLIAAGALIMAICIKRLGPETGKLKHVSAEAYEQVKPFASLHIALMSLFLVGYVAVGASLFLDIPIVGDLFVGVIFFFGAVFVLLGIMLQSKMTAALKIQYDRAMNANTDLETERSRLVRLNQQLGVEIAERNQAEAALTCSRAFLQTIIDSLPQQILVINRDYTVALANRTAVGRLGRQAINGTLHCHQLSHGSDTPCIGDDHPCPLKAILQTGEPATMEHVHTDASGEPMIVEIIAAPIVDDTGEIVQIVESCRDITQRRWSEDRLRESERKYRTILESIEDGYVEARLDGTITFVNPAMCRIMGHPANRLIGSKHRDFVSAETARTMHRQFKAVYETGRPCPISTYDVITASGDIRLLELSTALMRDRHDNPAGFRGMVRDVTELAAARKALEESEERYRKLSEVTMEGICFNDDSVIIDVNDTFVRMFGYRREELLGMDAARHLIAPESQSNVRHIVRSSSNETYEAVGVKKDGTRFPVEIEGRQVRYKGKAVRVASVRDITERKQAEQRLARMQKMEAIGTLAGGIAHDFNNILSSIMGYTEICQLKTDPTSQVAAHLGSILKASHRARELVAQILSFSRSEEEAVRPVQVGLIIKESLKLLRPSIPATIEIDARIDPQTGQIGADPTQIHQVIMNLCTNAAHAMRSAGGKLSIGLSDHDVADAPSNKLTGIAAGGYVRMIVSDTGKGMDAGTLERIFEPYFSTKEKGEGTGLGLFVVHGIVQRFGGWVDVESEPDQGTTFTICFPRIDADTDTACPETTAHPTGTETVLVVDDDENIVSMTSEMLGSLGYRVTPVTSAEAALELFARIPDRFGVVITDQTMPGMTGETLVARMREINPAIPVILCTGYSETMNAVKAQACGIDGFLMKPVEMADLARTVRQVIDRPQLDSC